MTKFKIVYKGRAVRGAWEYDAKAKSVVVITAHGRKSAPVRVSPAEAIAKLLLRELAHEGKA